MNVHSPNTSTSWPWVNESGQLTRHQPTLALPQRWVGVAKNQPNDP
ncbi:hypothetical protein GFS31_41510 (plasmid) [Leptolyngbya sp. BL0902]|nr:hypothetical protein GFS31_41510 [Leptolyngbya sp. BL0902]